MAKFNEKVFDAELFGRYVQTVPDVRRTEFIKSGVLVGNAQLDELFSAGTGSVYATIPFFGLADGEPVNYDGATNIGTETTKTYDWSVPVIGRAKGWKETDFATDVTGGVDFMDNVARQVSKYWDVYDQKTILSILKGVFAMTTETDFVENHTTDISSAGKNTSVNGGTLNTAMQRACGDNKDAFSLVVMHSAVATNLENLNLLEYLKYTDPQGIQRNLALATWNGRSVIVDDTATVDVDKYHTYILGRGAFAYKDVGVAVPYEMDRDPAKNGGETMLYTRQRKIFAPYGITYTKAQQASNSPTLEELENAENWKLVNDGTNKINHKAIPIARIISKG